MTEQEAIQDELTVEPSTTSGVVLLNFGDPRFGGLKPLPAGLRLEDAIFLRLIAYLPFAEVLTVPTRHIVDGAEMGAAMQWAQPLLKEGLIEPLLRADAASCSEYSEQRGTAAPARQRAAFLDRTASSMRRFRTDALSPAYLRTLREDLEPNGAFRRVVGGGMRGRHADALDQAWQSFLGSGAPVPESFVDHVQRFCRPAFRLASRWAMARYYYTPLRFDHQTTREIPREAATILQRGGVLDRQMQPLALASPAESALARISIGLPSGAVGAFSRQWCEAVMQVRQQLPEARRLFADIADSEEASEAAQTVEAALADEMRKQLRERRPRDRLYSLTAGLIGVGVGAALEAAAGPLVGAGGGLGVGVAGNELQKQVRRRHEKRTRPWALAIDQLDSQGRPTAPISSPTAPGAAVGARSGATTAR